METVINTVVGKQMSQKDAVYSLVTTLAAAAGLTVTQVKDKSFKSDAKKVLMKEVRLGIIAGINNGQISIKTQMPDAKLRKYVSGLVKNWIEKDSRLN